MTTPSTLPVQEPAGAVEAVMALAAKFAEAYAKVYFATQCGMANIRAGEDTEAAREALRSALASLPPVTQAKSEAVARVEQLTASLRHLAWLQEMPPVGTLLYTAPQEAVERQPLTRWQPIETAPKDATAILVMRNIWPGCENGIAEECNGHNTYVAEWWAGERGGAGAWICYMGSTLDPECPIEPTHWQPLPEPPGIGPATQEKP